MALVKFVTSEGNDTKEVKNAAGEITTAAIVTRKIESQYDFGDSLADAVAKFGEEVVFSAFVSSAKVDAQALIRRHLKSNVPAVEGVSSERPYTDSEIEAKLAAWKPGIKAERSAASATDKMEALLGKMTQAQKEEMIAKLQALAAA